MQVRTYETLVCEVMVCVCLCVCVCDNLNLNAFIFFSHTAYRMNLFPS